MPLQVPLTLQLFLIAVDPVRVHQPPTYVTPVVHSGLKHLTNGAVIVILSTIVVRRWWRWAMTLLHKKVRSVMNVLVNLQKGSVFTIRIYAVLEIVF